MTVHNSKVLSACILRRCRRCHFSDGQARAQQIIRPDHSGQLGPCVDQTNGHDEACSVNFRPYGFGLSFERRETFLDHARMAFGLGPRDCPALTPGSLALDQAGIHAHTHQSLEYGGGCRCDGSDRTD